jgi:UDP-glucose 4-epimerase
MIFVVGATGYIGRYLCPYLKNKGYDVLALGRSKNGQEFLEDRGIKFHYFDLENDAAFDGIETDNVEAIIDLSACLAELETPVKKFFEVNTLGVYKILEFAKNNGIKKVIVTSSHKVYNDINDKEVISETSGVSFTGEHSPYIISKIAAENFVEYYNKDFEMQGIVLRLTGVHGYGEILGQLYEDGSYKKSTFELFFEKALNGDDIEVWGNPAIKRDHIYIKDVLSAIECAIKSPTAKGVYNIASGVGYSQYEEACALAEVLQRGKKSKVTLYEDKTGLTRGYVYSIAKAENELGWKPSYTDLITMFCDYKMEWEKKEYHNYHIINDSDKPLTL